MTFREKFEKQYSSIGWCGCPHDHGYEERRGFYTHCASMSCDDCWNREIEEKEQKPMKHKLGETVLVQGNIIDMDYELQRYTVNIAGKRTAQFTDRELFELPKQDKTYEQGLHDAWELARKLYEMKLEKLQEVFGGFETELEVIQHLTPQEALAKLKAYEEESEIKVGDVVSNGTHVLLCVKEDYGYGYFYFLDKDGSHIFLTKENLKKSKFTKTGKHINIESLLEQIKGDVNE